mgnify:CR=1 FL=1
MSETITYPNTINWIMAGDVQFTGTGKVPNLSVDENSLTTACAFPVTATAQRALAQIMVPLTRFVVHDAPQTVLPGTSATDDLGLYGTAFGTNPPYIATSDLKAAGATTRYARVHLALPPNYDDGETVAIEVDCGMITTVADTSCTIDCQAYRNAFTTTVCQVTLGADLCSTAAQSMNSVTFAKKTFYITPTGLEVGQPLDVRLTIACNDAATGTAVIAAISRVVLACDTRGG